MLVLGFILGAAFMIVADVRAQRRKDRESEASELPDPGYYTWEELSAS